MSLTEDLDMVLHSIKAKLYPNYLPNAGGAYIARTSNERTLSVEDICTALKTRAKFEGDYNQLVDHVHKYLDEVAYQLCDGYAVNNGYYSIWPNIGGTFESVNEAHDHKKHPISFSFGIRSRLHRIKEAIAIEMEGLADTKGYIDKFTDDELHSVNGMYLAGNMISIHGHKIKLEGNNSQVGVYFIPKDAPGQAVKMERIAKNNPSEVTGIAPDTGHTRNYIEIRTQFTATGMPPAKTLREIKSGFVIEAG